MYIIFSVSQFGRESTSHANCDRQSGIKKKKSGEKWRKKNKNNLKYD